MWVKTFFPLVPGVQLGEGKQKRRRFTFTSTQVSSKTSLKLSCNELGTLGECQGGTETMSDFLNAFKT